MSLSGQVAIVTGAGRGLGRVIARELAGAGAKVFVTARQEAMLDEALAMLRDERAEVRGMVADVTATDAATEVVDAAASAFGRVDILVNNAATYLWKGFLDLSLDDWQSTLDTNLTAPFRFTTAMAKRLIAQGGGGSIINIGSVHGRFSDPSAVAQCATKAGLEGFTRAAAEALRVHRIRVNLIAPGAILPASERAHAEGPHARVTQNDVAQMVAFLASPLASSVTGMSIEAFGATHQILAEG